MKWSTTIGRFAGIDVKVHATFLLILIWVAITHWQAEQSLQAVAAGLLFILALFFCVVLHEYGHALTARRYAVSTKDIILLPIGGIARLARIPDNPRQELWIALAGPAVNVAIAAVLAIWLQVSATWQPVEELTVTGGSFAERLLVVNVFLVVFNLIPAFPMDGGRILRALLGLKLDYVRATQIAASVGQAVALIFGLIGLFANPFLVFIAFFVWIGAAQESSLVQMKSALSGIPVRQAMITDFRVLEPTHTLGNAVDLTLASSQKDFPVVARGQVTGILTQGDLLGALDSSGRAGTVQDAMQTTFEIADISEMMEPVFQRLQACACRTLPVVAGGHLAGLVTMDNVGEFLSIRAALEK
jgi:Zn-dependent protease